MKILCGAGGNVKIVSLDEIMINTDAEHVKADLSDFNVCRSITENIDYVFHLAGIKGSYEVTKSKPANFFFVPLLMMNTNVLEACRLSIKTSLYKFSGCIFIRRNFC